jgi:hypothetical protein
MLVLSRDDEMGRGQELLSTKPMLAQLTNPSLSQPTPVRLPTMKIKFH